MIETPRLIDLIQRSLPREAVKAVADGYQAIHAASVEARKAAYMSMVNEYYDLVTDFFEFGWGQSFHFAPRHSGETLAASLARHEFYLAHVLGLRPGMRVLDVGCGVGGPMRAIARFSGATIVGVNNNAYQIERGVGHNRAAGLDDRCSFIRADFINMPVPDNSFDAVYALEAICHAPDKRRAFSELYRVMKVGAQLAGYEWCLTPKYDPGNPDHRAIKKGIEVGGALPDIWTGQEAIDALRDVGFDLIAGRDLADTSDPHTPWWMALSGDWSISGFKHSPAGRWLANRLVRMLESFHVAPKGATAVSTFLNKGAAAMVRGGQTGIFTPLFFFHARKAPPGRATG